MNRRLISCIVVLLFVACGSTATDDPAEDTGQSPADTTEPPTDSDTPSDIAGPEPDAKVPSPLDTAVEPDTTEPDTTGLDITEPPVPDTTEPPEPDTTEPPVPDTTEPPEPAAITWTSHIQKIINTKCANCHTTQSKGGLKIKGYKTMDDPSPKCYSNMTVAEAISIKVQPNPGCKSKMPPYGKPPLSAEQKDQIKAWAEAGFPE